MSDTAVTESEEARARREIDELSQAAYVLPAPGSRAGRAPGECDVIMKGGITSGVVYPLTVCKLATTYRLRSIGGTSAGAIAAVMAAAAEYRRQTDARSPGAGFQALALLPHDISTRLAKLFQPSPETKGLYALLQASLSGGLWAVLDKLLSHQRAKFAITVVLVVLASQAGIWAALGHSPGILGGLLLLVGLVCSILLGVAAGLGVALFFTAREVMRVLPSHDFGLTDGATHSADPMGNPGLTTWLADQIDHVAGIDQVTGTTARCLTLGDLWGAEAVSAWEAFLRTNGKDTIPLGPVKRLRKIDLETMTTNLTVRRPFRLPFRDQTFLFDKAEMAARFPARVVEAMVGDFPPSDHRHPVTRTPLHYFPGPGLSRDGDRRPGPTNLPLVVMARMSLSFPGLISGVPLYAVDRDVESPDGANPGDTVPAERVVRHLFSDGGISSNFPMHFFDSLLPSRPTFGINLAEVDPRHPEMTWLPKATQGGIMPRAVPVEDVTGFAKALRDTMQNWSDNVQITQRGYASRVVEVRLSDTEGGMNLNMDPDVILRLVARGAEAGDRLLTFEWDPNRILRYRTAMVRLNEALETFDSAWSQEDYATLIEEFPSHGVASSYLGSRAWRDRDLLATRNLLAAVASWGADSWPALEVNPPAPSPVIRLAPE